MERWGEKQEELVLFYIFCWNSFIIFYKNNGLLPTQILREIQINYLLLLKMVIIIWLMFIFLLVSYSRHFVGLNITKIMCNLFFKNCPLMIWTYGLNDISLYSDHGFCFLFICNYFQKYFSKKLMIIFLWKYL